MFIFQLKFSVKPVVLFFVRGVTVSTHYRTGSLPALCGAVSPTANTLSEIKRPGEARA